MKKEEKLEHTIKIATFFLVNKNRNKICFFLLFPISSTKQYSKKPKQKFFLHQNLHGKIKFTLQSDYFKQTKIYMLASTC